MPTINHTITVTINGVDRTSALLKDSLYVRTSVANKGDTTSFTIIDDDTFLPLDWDEVIVSVDSVDIFGGYIIGRSASGVGSGSAKQALWTVECKDWSILFDQIIVNYGYTDDSDTNIVIDLFNRYLAAEGFDTASELTSVDNDVDVFFENVTFREALTTLAATAQANWHIAPDKTVYWYSPTLPSNAAFNIDVVAPDNVSTFDVLTDSISYRIDSSTIVNRVRVIGGEEQTGKHSVSFDADGTQSRFGPIPLKPGSIWFISYIVDGNTRYIYPSAIGYEPEDSLSQDGGDYAVLANLDERYIVIMEEDGSVPDAATSVGVIYYALEQVDVTVNDLTSQTRYGRVLEKVFYDESLNTASAQSYAENVINEYANGRESIRFDVAEHGLLPGRLIAINAPILDITATYDSALALETGIDALLLENGDRLMLENYGEPVKYLIQDVSIRSVVTGSNSFMVIASVTCGKYIPTLLDSLAQIQQFSAGTNKLPARRNVGSLGRISNNLGEVVAGRATFTDGGTAPFTWSNYADHTGIVIGLEDTDVDPYGAMYILQDGSVTTKVGRMDGLGSVGTVAPSGQGIWTNNGYFSGVIAATAGEIGGWTLANNLIYANGGTIATKNLPINSSNPGVYFSSAGLFGYGTLGLTFSIPTNPALQPYFSSGTINNVVYEVYESGVIRTSANPSANGGVQIDDSGIFAYATPANGGGLKFSVDANTGKMAAVDGTFSGSVTASLISGGTVTAAQISGGTITAAQISGGTITGGRVSGGTVAGGLISGGTVSGAVFSGGTVTQGAISAAQISGGTVTGAVVSAAQISGGTITGGFISGGTVSGGFISGGSASFASGTAVLNNSGLTLIPASSYTVDTPPNIKWKSGATLIGEITALNASPRTLNIVADPSSGATGLINIMARNSVSVDYMTIGGGTVDFYIAAGGPYLRLTSAGVRTGAHIISDASSSNRQLGQSGNAFRYLYLKDDNGNDRRVSINSSGVLTVT